MKTFTLVVASALFAFAPPALAQTTTPDTPPATQQDAVDLNALMQEAQTYQNQQQFIEAAEIYLQVTEAQPENGVAWFNLGYCLHLAGELDLAINAHRKAATFEQFAGIGQYNLGCAYALLGESDEAFEALIASYEAGFNLGGQLDADSDLDSLRDDPRFEELVAMAPPRDGGMGMGGVQTIVEKAQAFLEQNGPALMAQARTWAENAKAMAQEKIQELRYIAEDEEHMAELRVRLEGALARAHEAFSAWRVSQGDPEVVAVAEAVDVDQLRNDAEEQFVRSNFGEAAELYGELVKHDPDNGEAWFRLGYSLHFEEQLEKALKVHLKAAEFDQYRGIALYNAACANSLLGHTDAAFEMLDKCKEAGFANLPNMEDDADFDNIRDDPRFQAFVDSLGDG